MRAPNRWSPRSTAHSYIYDAGKQKVVVIERGKLTVIAPWPIQEYIGLAPLPDAEHHPYVRKNVPLPWTKRINGYSSAPVLMKRARCW